jgi:hypothetical protein
MNQSSIPRQAFYSISRSPNVLRHFFLYPTFQNGVFNIFPIKIVIQHFFFGVSDR